MDLCSLLVRLPAPAGRRQSARRAQVHRLQLAYWILPSLPSRPSRSPKPSPPCLQDQPSCPGLNLSPPALPSCPPSTNGVFVSGNYSDAEVVASGTSKVSLSGLNPDSGAANVTVTGITTVWIEGGPGEGRAAPLSGSRGDQVRGGRQHCLDPGGTR